MEMQTRNLAEAECLDLVMSRAIDEAFLLSGISKLRNVSSGFRFFLCKYTLEGNMMRLDDH